MLKNNDRNTEFNGFVFDRAGPALDRTFVRLERERMAPAVEQT